MFPRFKSAVVSSSPRANLHFSLTASHMAPSLRTLPTPSLTTPALATPPATIALASLWATKKLGNHYQWVDLRENLNRKP